jgi:hypothetical protein
MVKGKGTNPNSHHNAFVVAGTQRKVQMADEYWEIAKIIGLGEYSKGIRETMKNAEVTAIRNWEQAAFMLGCDSSPSAIEEKLVELYPDIKKGDKSQKHLISEIALGNCILRSKKDDHEKIVRTVRLSLVQIDHEGKTLVEAYQQLRNGKRLYRNIVGVAKKTQTGESSRQTALRGLKEKLNVTPEGMIPTAFSFDLNTHSKYKGIESYLSRRKFLAALKDEDIHFRYEDSREECKIVFVWAKPIQIDQNRLATKEEYELSKTSSGSLLESLKPGENVLLGDGVFTLDNDFSLNLID